jgi:gamma-glutamyl:cysteine ligase YbdK (ATP-grasp superfamily)
MTRPTTSLNQPIPALHMTRSTAQHQQPKNKRGIIISIHIFIAIPLEHACHRIQKEKANRYFHFILLSAATFV